MISYKDSTCRFLFWRHIKIKKNFLKRRPLCKYFFMLYFLYLIKIYVYCLICNVTVLFRVKKYQQNEEHKCAARFDLKPVQACLKKNECLVFCFTRNCFLKK